MNSHCHTIINGIIGTSASFMGFLSTFQTQLEWWVRMTGGILGIIVAIITLWNLLKPKK
jgi:uncharacterized ion transporter superfamily protein YfcC